MAPTEARDVVNSRFGGKIVIMDRFTAKNRQLASKIYHAPEFGLKPEDYGMTYEQLELIRRLQLIEYTARGHDLPPKKFVVDFGNKIKEHCSINNIIPYGKDFINEDGVPRKAHSFGDPTTYRKVFFNPWTGQFISSWHQSETKFDAALEKMKLELKIPNLNSQPQTLELPKRDDI